MSEKVYRTYGGWGEEGYVKTLLNLTVPTFYVDGTEQTQIHDVDIDPAYDKRHQPEWKIEPMQTTITVDTPEWLREFFTNERQKLREQVVKALTDTVAEEIRESIRERVEALLDEILGRNE
ncbi:MAG: hypothetical protein IJJ20_03460 [Thermoguttaceae bacterium]|nr:hypothetical protein [Thermoguttaceae bacterium]